MPHCSRMAHDIADLEPNSRYRALLFDWDGTLVDSLRTNYAVTAESLAERDLPLDWDWYQTQTGISGVQLIAQVAQDHGRIVDVDEIARDCAAKLRLRLTDISLVEHVANILREHHTDRLTALATGGPAAIVLPTVASLGIADMFDVVVTLSDVERGKPHPDIFRKVAELLDVPPQECLVYEDTDEGLLAAQRAGMDSIDVRPIRQQRLGY
jgi:beta-phosphoglucomutase-like phosphatase (HAD superfamily)